MKIYRKTEYLELSEGELVDVGDLQEFITDHPEIERVILFWSYQRDMFTSNASIFEAYVSEHILDVEYCFDGGRDAAIEYAKHYDQWDGHDMILLMDGKVLYGYYDDYDMDCSWNDGYNHVSGIHEGIDPSWISFIRVDTDYATGTEYLLSPDPYPKEMKVKK